MNIKEVFDKAENGTLTYEQFQAAAEANKAKFVDLSEGKYVSTGKYNDDLAAKAKEIETLNGTIATRDTDLEGLKKQLEEAGVDATKLQETTTKLAELQSKYDGDTKAYKEQLKKQAYEFAVKEYTATQKFTSSAAKRDFERALLSKDLKMENDKILGASDFVEAYKAENADAFLVEDPNPNPNPNGGQDNSGTAPHFVQPTQGEQGGVDPTGGFNFNFTGVRPKETN
jgi:vacuolar-type H+-ATPase subunit I/STV1